MFSPTRDQARDFLFELWQKHQAAAPLTPLEGVALAVILQHPEYQAMLANPQRYRDSDWTPEAGETNPFLHMMMHLAIEEQLSIDQPPGIRAAVETLARRRDSDHDARHDVMDCLAEMIWQAQRNGAPFDNASYLDCLKRKSG
jgi:hypothetical protein